MVREAQQHEAEDRRRRELIEARNQADALVYSVEKTLNENRARLASPDVQRIESALAAVKTAMQGEDAAAIRRAIEDLQRASHAMAEELYRRTQAGASSGGTGSSASGSGPADVVEGEFAETR